MAQELNVPNSFRDKILQMFKKESNSYKEGGYIRPSDEDREAAGKVLMSSDEEDARIMARKILMQERKDTPFGRFPLGANVAGIEQFEYEHTQPPTVKVSIPYLRLKGQQPAEFEEQLVNSYKAMFLDGRMEQALHYMRKAVKSDRLYFRLHIRQDWEVCNRNLTASLAAAAVSSGRVFEYFVDNAYATFRRRYVNGSAHDFQLTELHQDRKLVNVVSTPARLYDVWETRMDWMADFRYLGDGLLMNVPNVNKPETFYGNKKFTEQEFLDELKQFEE